MSVFIRILPSPLALVMGLTIFALWEKHGNFEPPLPSAPQKQMSTTVAVATTERAIEVQKDDLTALDAFETAVSRPLFIEGREPRLFRHDLQTSTSVSVQTQVTEIPDQTPEVVTPVVPPPAIEPTRPEIDLRGYMDEGTQAAALVFNFQTNSEYWLHVGDKVGDWTVAAVGPRSVTFRADEFEFVVTLFE